MRRLITLAVGLLWLASGHAVQSDVDPTEVERFTDGDCRARRRAVQALLPGLPRRGRPGRRPHLHAARRDSHQKGISSSFPTDFCLRVDTGERLWSSSYDESERLRQSHPHRASGRRRGRAPPAPTSVPSRQSSAPREARSTHQPRGASPKLILAAAAVLLSLSAATTVGATSPEVRSGQAGPVAAEFRGCASAGWCRFWIRSPDPLERGPLRVYPDGVPRTFSDEVAATAVRDRMNALLASMIHQHKRIVLHGLREAGAGAYAARVTVNDADLASDPVLLELRGQHRGRIP